ncbi:MAG: hypothetical protein ACJATW_002266 [Glaciecola sp.]|jgi:hypothetical protein
MSKGNITAMHRPREAKALTKLAASGGRESFNNIADISKR